MLEAASLKKPSANFSVAEIQTASTKALKEYFNINDNFTPRELREHRNEYFAIMEEVVDRVLPEMMTNILGDIAEVKSFERDSQVLFKIKGLGANRVKAAIVPGARGGVYRARRLDSNEMTLNTRVYTVGYSVTLEDILAGSRSVADVLEVITEGLAQQIWIEIVKALRAAYAAVPANNKATASGDTIDLKGIDKIVRTVGAYGTPFIIGFSSLIDQISNLVPFQNAGPNINGQDLIDVREQGYVGKYKGTAVIKLPNYFVDESNSQWLFKETDIFVLPSDARPVKVALRGDAYTAEVQQPHGGMEWHLHKMMGVGILFYNNIGIYQQTGTSALDADGLY